MLIVNSTLQHSFIFCVQVRYLHDGSENHQDSIVMELELAPGPGFVLPNYLQGHHRFVLHVNVTPINDPPALILPPGTVLRLAQVGIRCQLSKYLTDHKQY